MDDNQSGNSTVLGVAGSGLDVKEEFGKFELTEVMK